MRRLSFALMALGLAAVFAMPASTSAEAAMAANQSKMSGVQTLIPGVLPAQYLVDRRRWHRGCYRRYYCRDRHWRGGYRGGGWHYGDCYYSGCYDYRRGGGYRGGYGRGGGY